MKKCVELKNNFISKNRMSQYEDISEYFDNLKVCKDYYIPLALVEIALRNSINKVFHDNVSPNWLLNKYFIKPQHQHKIDISIKLLKFEKKEILNDNILAELSFGFFVTFFKQPYQKYLRYIDLKKIFPNLPSSSDKKINRHFIFTKLNNIRLFRNKVFHHNKIINKLEYENMLDEIYEVLNYFDEEIVHITQELNKLKK